MVKIIEGYILNEVIGEGNFGLVYRATHKEKQGTYAVKVIPVQKFQENEKLEIYTNSQIEALQTIGISDYIIRFYEMIKSKNNSYLVYEFCNGGTLMSLIKKEQRLEEKKALLIFKQLLEAFKVLNKNNIMHRDLKPENIFFTSSTSQEEGIEVIQGDSEKKKVKLGDFGFCKGLKPDENLAKTMLGSPIYMAPEVLKGESYSTKADIWSLGVILFQMIYGYCPFESRSIANLISTIDTQVVQIPSSIPVTEKTQNLIRRMLAKDYFRRIGWVQLFGIKIDQNGQYTEELNSSNEERRSTPGKKVFTSLFGSMSFQTNSVNFHNHRSSSSMKNEQAQKKNSQSNIGRLISKKQTDESKKQQNNRLVADNNTTESRGTSQSKNQKKFYSQNYMSVLSTPFSLKKIQDEENKSKEKGKISQIQAEQSRVLRKSQQNQTKRSPQKIMPSSPLLPYRSDRVSSMNIIDDIKVQSSEYRIGGNINGSISTQAEPIPFNKYRQNIGMGSSLYAKFLSDKNIKEQTRSSMGTSIPTIGSQFLQLETKRSNLLKIHEGVTKTLQRAMCVMQEKVEGLKICKNNEHLSFVKDFLQDCYIILKIAQQKLKNITESIKITQTSLLDMASIVNYEHIQVEKFLIEIRNQLLRWSVELPNLPNSNSGTQISDIKNGNLCGLRSHIKNEEMVKMIQECF